MCLSTALTSNSDYVGGLLTAAMYGRPLLREDSPSNLRFTVLLNPPMFTGDSDSHFQAEYLLMHDDQRISDHFSLKRRDPENIFDSLPAPMADLLSMMQPGGLDGHPGAGGYFTWDAVVPEKEKLTHGEDDLLPRPALEKWLYALFLKICLPYPRERFSDRPVMAPLNLTAFLRLLALLSERGYPAHWLSGVVAALCGGEVETTARAPRRVAADPAEVDAVHPARKMSVAPWRAEFTTLLSVWSRLLPFGFVAPPGALVGPRDVAEYSVEFPAFEEEQVRVPHFVLVFWDSKYRTQIPNGRGMRRALLDDETVETVGGLTDLGRRSIRVVSVFKYVPAARMASWWCRADVMREMTDGEWGVYVWRTDTWEQVTKGVGVKDVRELRTWEQ